MARQERRRLSFGTAALLLGAFALAGCATGFGGGPATDDELARLRARVAELEREARVREIEVRRLRAALAESPPPTSRPALQASRPDAARAPVEDLPAPAGPGTEMIEENDLDVSPIPAPTPPPPASAPPPVPAAAATPRAAATPAPAEAQALYDEAYSLFHQKQYDRAEASFAAYLERYPGTRLADNARFWIGECRYARGDLEGALEAFLETVERYPDGNKVPDAMVKAGKCLEALGDLERARETYLEVQRSHPGTAAAAIAEERLLMLR